MGELFRENLWLGGMLKVTHEAPDYMTDRFETAAGKRCVAYQNRI
jgi:hypothetical protein